MVEVNLLGAMSATGCSSTSSATAAPDVRVIVIEPGAVALIIAFAVTRPRSVSLNEILVRPTAQAG